MYKKIGASKEWKEEKEKYETGWTDFLQHHDRLRELYIRSWNGLRYVERWRNSKC